MSGASVSTTTCGSYSGSCPDAESPGNAARRSVTTASRVTLCISLRRVICILEPRVVACAVHYATICDWRTCRLISESGALPQCGRVVHSAVGDDTHNLAKRSDVFQRIAVDHDEVGAFAGFDRADGF